ncbi:protein kinase [Nocardia sp. NPDC059177]|uniref:serine/threonine-protein kinase n=1 Tax=Nocardia sp. NPDC059177 TaxID=3346759 RepID=UPI0036A61E27
MPLDPGSVFAGYVIERRLGAGGMGEVYQARHPRLPRSDALKVLTEGTSNDPTYRQRFEREADLAARLSHPNIVKVHDRGESDGQLWITLELIDGPDFAELATRSRTGLPLGQVRQAAVNVAGALDYAHSRGLLHRDVKPANIMINSQGWIMLADFGIARLAVEETNGLTSTGMTPGTINYSSPEQLHGHVLDGQTDQYSLACTIFRLLTGHNAYENSNPIAVISAHLALPVPSVRQYRPELSPAVDAAIARAMAKDPQDRFASCAEFAENLAAALDASDTSESTTATMIDQPPAYSHAPQPYPAPQSHTPSPPPPAAPRASRERPWIGASVVLVAVLVAATLFVFKGGSVVRALGGGGVGTVDTWDDTLHPREIASLSRLGLRDEFIDVGSPPKAEWTTPVNGGSVRAVGGNDDIVVVAGATHVGALDVATGEVRWPFVDVQTSVGECAIKDNRIACVAPPYTGGDHDSTVTIHNADNGQVLRTVKVPNRDLERIVIAGDRFVAYTDYSPTEKGYAVGYTTEGDQTWQRETAEESLVMASEQILVDGNHDSAQVVFVSTVDGHEILAYTRPDDVGSTQQFWDVFQGGIAILNADWTGTEFYDRTGKKTASISGWEPAGYQLSYTNTHPLPLLTRIDPVRKYSHTANTLAAANPETGHLLWRISDPGINPRRINTFEDLIVMEVSDPSNPDDDSFDLDQPASSWFRVFDSFTGEAKSPPVNLAVGESAEYYWVELTGYQLMYTFLGTSKMEYVTKGFDMHSGEQSWESPLPNRPTFIGTRMYVTDDTGISFYS